MLIDWILNGLFLLLATAVVLFAKHYLTRRQHPPGTLGCPYFGVIPRRILQNTFPKYFPKMNEMKYFRQMKEKYGKIWSEEFGRQRIIVLASLELMQEAFIENATLFSGRPTHEIYKVISQGKGILFVDGKLWQENRQLAIKALRYLGMGNQSLETQICNEIDVLIEYIELNANTPLESPNTFVKAVSNIISRLAFNERNKYEDANFQRYIDDLKTISHSNEASNMITMSPKFFQTKLARHLFPSVDKFLKSVTNVLSFTADKCRSRILVEKEYSKPSCVFDFFWRYRYQDDANISYEDKFLHISQSMFDLFNAGIDTTTNMLSFSCVILGKYRHNQEELRQEIHALVDDYKLINMEHKKDCPKLSSFIDEVQRFCNLAPRVHHRVLRTCEFKGYKLYPSDIIFGDLSTVLHDPELFKNPDTFDSHRFLDPSNNKYVPNKSLIPFGIGKRACLGEGIAVMEMFLFLAKIIHRFDISLTKKADDNLDEILIGTFGLVHAPLDHDIIFKINDLN